MQKGHCINDTSKRLMDHISWWNLFFQMPCQSGFVGFLIVPLQSAREHDSILIDVWAVHCMHKKHLVCFYKNLLLVFVLFFPNDLQTSSSFLLACMRSSQTSLNAADAVNRQTSSKGFMQDNGLNQLFSYRFLSIMGGLTSTWTMPDVWTWNICLRF